MSAGGARLLALAAALLFSTGGAAIKTDAFSALQISSLRAGIAALTLVVWLRGGISWSPLLLGTAAVYAATLTLFVAATKLTTAANAIFLQSTAPIYVLLAGPALLGERRQPIHFVYMGVIGAGLILCFLGAPERTTTAPDPALGNVLGIVCSLTWACTLLGLRRLAQDSNAQGNGIACVIAGNIIACLAGLPFSWPLPVASMSEWATLVYLGVVQIGVAYVCLTRAFRQLPALDVSLLLLLEPVLNPVWTWLIRGERPGAWAILGGAMILTATGAKSWSDSRRPPLPSAV